MSPRPTARRKRFAIAASTLYFRLKRWEVINSGLPVRVIASGEPNSEQCIAALTDDAFSQPEKFPALSCTAGHSKK